MLEWPRATPTALSDFLSLLAPDARAAIRLALDESVAQGTGFDLEFPINTTSGEVKWVRIAGEPAWPESGPTGVVNGALQDITSLKQVEKKLRDQAALLDKAQDAIWVLGLDGTVEFWNLSAEIIYGWSLEEVQRQGLQKLLYPQADQFDAALKQTRDHGEWVGEIEQANREGGKILLVSRWTLVKDEDGRPRAILSINTDVTQQRSMEQQLLRAQRMESIGTLAGGIAHDLNNVLSPIMMSIELLKDIIPPQEDPSLLRTIEVSARRGADMVKQVLSFARGIEGRRHEVRLQELLRDLEQILTETVPKNISITSDTAPDLWLIHADPTQLQQVLLNLCVNARDAMPNGGRIQIKATNMMVDEHYAAMNLDAKVGAYLKIEVQDDGTGIAPEIMERIFDPFFTTKPQGEGTGLGLATTLAIVKGHGGYIRAYSEPGRGTRFRIYLPADPSLSGEDVVASPIPVPRGKGELIMVVDDEAAIRQVTRMTLEAGGYRAVVASNGAEAVALYARDMQDIELVIVDMMMPVMDGPATIQALRMINPAVRIVGASGIPQNGKLDAVVNSGVHHFLPKPCTADVMLRTVHAAMTPEV